MNPYGRVDEAKYAHLSDEVPTAPRAHHPRPAGKAYIPKDYAVTPQELEPAAHADCMTCQDWQSEHGTAAPQAPAPPATAAAAPTYGQAVVDVLHAMQNGTR